MFFDQHYWRPGCSQRLLLLLIANQQQKKKAAIKKTGIIYSFLYWIIVFTMSSATSFFVFAANWYSFLFLSKIVILLVSIPKSACLSFNEFNTIISAFFFDNLLIAFSFSFSVSSAKPTNV